MKKFTYSLLFLALITLAGCTKARTQDVPRTVKSAKNVIYFIGDGLGAAQITLARMASKKKKLTLDNFKVLGKSQTHCLDNLVTDSAAGATALASGWKTNRGAVGMIPQPGKKWQKVQSLAQMLHKKGYVVGLVTTTRITHATPAAFLTHVPSRYQEDEIARQYLNSGAQLLLGGGKKKFSAELLQDFAKRGYKVVTTKKELMATDKKDKVLGLFSSSHMSYEVDRTRDKKEPSLREMTEKAVEILSAQDKPFFLMVEGGRIDHAGHVHDAPSMVKETQAFDRAIGWSMDWVKSRRHEGLRADTLIVVTADHTTGSVGISKNFNNRSFDKIEMSAEEMFSRIAGGEESFEFVLKVFAGIDDLTKWEQSVLKGEFEPSGGKKIHSWTATKTLGHIISQRKGIYHYPLTYYGPQRPEHTGEDVPVYAYGPKSYLFSGTYDNREIPLKIARALGLSFQPRKVGKAVKAKK